MAITISNLRIIPWSQKDTIKPIFGDTMTLTFTLPEAYQQGDEYTLALDYERILIPTDRPVCALTSEFTIAGNNITFDLLINTERFAQWVSRIKKPMPCWLQIQRKRGDIYETILLDDVLALPSVIDGANTVFPGTPIASAIEWKLDKPAEEGEAGNVLKLGSDGQPVWGTGGGGGGDVYWNDIQGKPDFATVASTGDYSDLIGTPTIPVVNNATITFMQGGATKGVITLNQATASTITLDQGGATSWDEITGKPTFATVASTGSYNDLVSKPTFATVASTGNYADLTSKPTLATVATTGLYSDLVSAPTLAPVATTGDYNDLTSKPQLATVATTGLYSDLSGTPTLATVASTGSYDDLISKPTIPTVNDATITLTQGGVSKGSFTLNQSTGATIALDLGGAGTLSVVDSTVDSSLVISPSSEQALHVLAISSATISAVSFDATKIGFLEVILDTGANVGITAGDNLTMMDVIIPEARQECLVRWVDGTAKMYVLATSELPATVSSALNQTRSLNASEGGTRSFNGVMQDFTDFN